MKILLDTHVIVWAMKGVAIRGEAGGAITSGEHVIFASIVSLWELGIKISIGKLDLPQDVFTKFRTFGFEILPIKLEHIEELRKLPHHHRDPFDRMLVAQARSEQLILATRDGNIKKYPGVTFLEA